MIKINFRVVIFPVLFLTLIAAFHSVFIVHQTEQVLVLELGKLVRVLKSPGLYLKVPVIQETLVYDNRILGLDIPPTEVTLGDQKRSVVDMFVRYQISNPSLFYKAVRNENGARQRLMSLVSGILRSTLGKKKLIDLLSERRTSIMNQICLRANEAVKALGIYVIDVRIVRADLPPANSVAIFSRMISERHKEALEIRAFGKEKSHVIRAEAVLQGDLILAKAIEEAGYIKAQGAKKAQTIYLNAYEKNTEFAHFYQTLEAYRQALKKDTFYILDPNHPFLQYFQHKR